MRSHRRGFTLIEILIVVVLLGLLAAMVVPQFSNAGEGAKAITFATNIKGFSRAAQLYTLKTGLYLEDSATGALPTGFGDFIDPDSWLAVTPIGGHWDAEFNEYGVTSAVGVHFDDGSNPGAAYMTELDGMCDDGDLTTGAFREMAADRFYWIVAN